MEFISAKIFIQESNKPYSFDSDLNGEITLLELLEFTKSALIVTADQILREEQLLGFDKRPVIAVDGKVGKPVATVHPLGQIEFTSKVSMNSIILDTYQGILDRSPVDTGLYKKSHYVFLNGTQVATDLGSLTLWLNTNPQFKQEDFIRFVNIQPYARKLERFGVRAGESGNTRSSRTSKSKKKSGETRIRVNQPNGAYYVTTRSIRSKYKRNSVIKFTFISGDNLGISGSFKTSRRGKPGRRYLYPSITISVQESGIL